MSAVDEIAVQEMVQAILIEECNLDDERAVLRALMAWGIDQGDILALMTEATKRAKKFKQGEK